MATKRVPLDAMAFPRREAAALGNLSYWKLREWSRDLYQPSWGADLFTFRDLLALRTLSELRSLTTKSELRKVGDYLRRNYREPWSTLRFGIGPHRKVYYWEEGSKRWLRAGEAAAQQTIAPYALDHIHRELEREVRRSRQRDPATVGQLDRKPGICGNRWRVAGTRITVDALKPYIRRNYSDTAIRRNFPTLRAEDISRVREFLAAA